MTNSYGAFYDGSKSGVGISASTMEIFRNFQSDGLKDQRIRATAECPKRVAVYDVIKVITGNVNPHDTWNNLSCKFPEELGQTEFYTFPGKGRQTTPVVGARGLVTLMNLLKGDSAARFRAAEADVLVRYLGGDLSLIAEVQGIRQMQEDLPTNDPARIFGEEVEAQQQLPYSHQQMMEMQQAAKTIVAIKEDIVITTKAVSEFPFDKYSKYVELSAEMARIHATNAATDERQLGTKAKRFALKQQEDAHAAEMQQQRAAPRIRVAAEPQGGITVARILQNIGDPALTKRAKERQVALDVFEQFRDDLIPGSYGPRRYHAEAEGPITAAIKEWVGAGRQQGISKYFRAAQAV